MQEGTRKKQAEKTRKNRRIEDKGQRKKELGSIGKATTRRRKRKEEV